MDKLLINRPYGALCGKDIAFNYAAAYILEHSEVVNISKMKVAIVSDRIVSGYFYNQFENQFIVRGIRPSLISVECQEASKGLSAVDEVYKHLNDFGFGPSDWIIALGGGGVLDVTSFVVATMNNGINYMAVPTTLCAMSDVCISNKTYLNVGKHKDQISANNKPDIILADPTFLKNLPDKIKFNGFASVIRYSILEDLTLLMKLSNPGDLREYLNSVYKTRFAIEGKNEKLLTLGSEIASAIEAYFRFMNYSEGEALALSLLASVDDKRRAPMTQIYKALGLPTKLEGVSGKMIIKTLKQTIDINGYANINLVDFDDVDGGSWVIKSVTPEEAMTILTKRVAYISDLENS